MHEMLNEYQALWQTLKDVRDGKTQPIVLFNTMRNILEYYFSFACKTEKLKEAPSLWQPNTAMPESMIHFIGLLTGTLILMAEISFLQGSSIRNVI